MFDWDSTTWPKIYKMLRAVVEILLLTIAIYQVNRFFRGTRGAKILLGILVVLVGLAVLITLFKLEVMAWIIMQVIAPGALVGLLVIFQPEIRAFLAKVGSNSLFSPFAQVQQNEFFDNLCQSVKQLSNKRIGALFALERSISLKDHAETGVEIDALFSPELTLTIFFPKTTLHDGGMIIHKERIVAAGCVFPVSRREMNDRSLGLRHRSAVGITEESDSIAIVVSEETGHISLAHAGKLERNLSAEEFRVRLEELMNQKEIEDETTAD